MSRPPVPFVAKTLCHSVSHGATRAVAEPVERRVLLSASFDGLHTLAAADFNGDGAAESIAFGTRRELRRAGLNVVGRNFRRGAWLVIGGTGDLFSDPMPFRGGVPQVVVADFTSDGRPDLLVGGRRAGLDLFTGAAGGTFSAATRIQGVPAGVASIQAADVNGDGRQDLIVAARRDRAGATGATTGISTGAATDGNRFFFGTDFLNGAFNAAGFGLTAPVPGGVTAEGGAGAFDFFGDAVAPPSHSAGVSAEAGGGVAGAGNSLLSVGTTAGGDAFEILVLLGNGNGTFQSATRISGAGSSS